jgi:Na+/H+ antiporter NhaD/arsenite permease-like protein
MRSIIPEQFNRVIVALLEAALVDGSGVLSQGQAIRGIDFNTIGLLSGMMILVGITKESAASFNFLRSKPPKVVHGEYRLGSQW